MLVTTADHWDLAPGTVVSWTVDPAGGPHRTVDLAPHQVDHLAGALAGEPSVWMVAALDVDGPVDVPALERAYRAVVARHDALRVRADVVDGALRGSLVEASDLCWTRRPDVVTTSAEQTREHLGSRLDAACWPLCAPAVWAGAVSRPGRSTLVLGLDHLHVDAYSLAVLVDDLHLLYDGVRRGRRLPDLPATSCCVGGRGRSSVRVPDDDPRLATWLETLARLDHRLPTFPLPLGVGPGERVPQHTEVSGLGDARLAERVGLHARHHGGSASAAVLGALATAVRGLGGPATLPVLTPVHLRRTPAEHRTVGWLTATVPLELATGRDPCATLGQVARSVGGARPLAAVPLDQVLERSPRPLVRERTDVFMASYLDYRRLPGHEHLRGRRAHHVSAPTRADDLQVWVSRTDRGLGVRVRCPATATARATVAALLERWRHALAASAVPCVAEPGTLTPAGPPARRRGSP